MNLFNLVSSTISQVISRPAAVANNAAIGTNSVMEVKKTNKRLQDDFTLTSAERKLKLIDQLHCEHDLKSPFHVIQLPLSVPILKLQKVETINPLKAKL